MFTIVTGASENHFKTLKQFLRTVPVCGVPYKCYVYDLGLNSNSFEELKREFPSFIYRTFDYSKYPSYFNINVNAGEYGWKPVIIEEVSKEENGILLWLDAGDKIISNLTPLIEVIRRQGIFTPVSSSTVSYWTHKSTQRYMGVENDRNLLSKQNRNGAIIGFDLSSEDIRNFVTEFSRLAQIKECIAPEGSSRTNHRQDQAMLSILYYKHFGDARTEDRYMGLSIHNDID
jgi:hypothetical protein